MNQNTKLIEEEGISEQSRINSPKILIIIFEINELNNTKIEIKEKLDITTYTLFENENTNKNIIYNLYGIVSKIKNENENHFIASCYDYDNNIWYKYDDKSDIKKINNLQVFDDDNKIPLILFYYLED